MNYRTLYATVEYVGVATLNSALPTSSANMRGAWQPPPPTPNFDSLPYTLPQGRVVKKKKKKKR